MRLAIRQTIRSLIRQPIRLSDGELPPSYDKLIVWLQGENTDSTHKTDSINGYDFTIANCPPDYELDMNGDPILDMNGDPSWSTLLYAGWGCEYTAPASGEDGYAELLAIDDDTLYAGGVPNVLTKAAMELIDNGQMFWDHTREAWLIFDQVLTGDELFFVLEYCGKAEALTRTGVNLIGAGEILYRRIN